MFLLKLKNQLHSKSKLANVIMAQFSCKTDNVSLSFACSVAAIAAYTNSGNCQSVQFESF